MLFDEKRRPPTFDLLGGKIESIDEDTRSATVSWALGEQFTNPIGTIQGGFLAAVLDDTAAIAYLATKEPGWLIPSVEMKTSYLAPALPGKFRAEAKVVKDGRTIAFLEARLFDDAGKLLAVSSITGCPTPIERIRKKASSA